MQFVSEFQKMRTMMSRMQKQMDQGGGKRDGRRELAGWTRNGESDGEEGQEEEKEGGRRRGTGLRIGTGTSSRRPDGRVAAVKNSVAVQTCINNVILEYRAAQQQKKDCACIHRFHKSNNTIVRSFMSAPPTAGLSPGPLDSMSRRWRPGTPLRPRLRTSPKTRKREGVSASRVSGVTRQH